MEELKPTLKRLLSEAPSSKLLFLRNILKEYLQIVILDYLYSHPAYSKLVFYGGSCFAQCHGLPRLSGELGLAKEGDSDLLILKIEVFRDDGTLRECKAEAVPIFKVNRSIIVKAFDLSTLMSTKIRAILHRKWEKTSKSGKTLAIVKGRDYFDLMWYLRKGVSPNMACIKEATNKDELKRLLLSTVDKFDPTSIKFDLEALIADDRYVTDISKNLRDILKSEIERM